MPEYLFKSSRLGFREWSTSDLDGLYAMNTDPEVMAFFPKLYTKAECQSFILKMKKQFEKRGYCYFAVDTIADNRFVGFIGISYQDYESSFTPCIDIGWRLKRSAWGKGLATEGAIASLDYAFNSLGIQSVYSVAPEANINSIAVMKKIGMHEHLTFNHPKLSDYPRLRSCVVYKIEKS